MSNRSIVIRAATEADADTVTWLFDVANPSWATSAGQRRRQAGHYQTPANGIVLVAEEHGRVVGSARANEALEGLLPQPGTFSARVAVDPGAAGNGIGRRLWQAVAEWLEPQSPREIVSWADRDDNRSVAIAASWGFDRRPGSVESPDDLDADEPWAWDYELPLDPVHLPHPETLARLPAAIAVSTLAEALDDPHLTASLHEAHEECRADVPAWERYEPKPRPEFEEAQRERLGDGGAGLVAHRNRQVVAATFAERAAFVPVFHSDFTMARRSARGQGLAIALKSRLVEQAAACGIERITTEVRSDNHPMLAVNAALGFRRIAMRQLVRSNSPELSR